MYRESRAADEIRTYGVRKRDGETKEEFKRQSYLGVGWGGVGKKTDIVGWLDENHKRFTSAEEASESEKRSGNNGDEQDQTVNLFWSDSHLSFIISGDDRKKRRRSKRFHL